MGKILDERDVRTSFPNRLVKAIGVCKRKMDPVLKNRNRMLKGWLAGYLESGDTQQVHMINLIDRMMKIMVPYLVMANPKVLVKTRFTELRPWAYTMELALNFLLSTTKFDQLSLRPAVRNSMVGMGIVKTGLMHTEEVNIMGYNHAIGQSYTDVVDDSDYVFDPTAKGRESMEFEGNLYYLPTAYAKEFFGGKKADLITPDSGRMDEPGTPAEISRAATGGEEYTSLREYTQLADIWLPDENAIVTILPRSNGRAAMLRQVEWDGPEGSPYDALGYQYFPEEVIPIPPVWGCMDMDRTMNVLVQKMRRIAENQKTVLGFEGNSAEDAARLTGAADREAIRMENLDGVKLFEYPGIDKGMYDWMAYMESQWSSQGSNLNTMGGRNVMAGTLGQEQMLMSNASRTVDDMVNSVYAFTQSILKKRAWYLWTDPLVDIPMIRRIEGFGDINVRFSKSTRRGDFYNYSFDIEPYSMQRMNPQAQFQQLMMVVTQWLLPVSQLAASQGVQIDINEATKIMARLIGLTEIDAIWKSAVPQNIGMNPYSPEKGSAGGKGVADGRTGMAGAASNLANLMQQQSRAGGQSSPPQQ
jgi:hypothetical protein